MSEIVTQFLINILEIILMIRFMGSFLKGSLTKNKILVTSFVIFSAVCFTAVNVHHEQNVLNLIVSISIIALVSFFFEGKWGRKILFSVFYVILSMVLEVLVSLIVATIFASALIKQDSEDYLIYITMITVYSLKTLVILIIYYRRRKMYAEGDLKIYLHFTIVPIFSIFLACIVVNKLIQYDDRDFVFYSFLIISLAFVNAMQYFIFERMNVLYRNSYENKLSEQELKHKDEYYNRIEMDQQEIRMIRHDLKNQLIVLKSVIGEKSWEEAAITVDSIINGIIRVEKKIFTQHRGVNIILNAKMEEAETYKIQCDFNVSVPEQLKLTAGDIGVLLGNTLDNAIEACQMMPEGEGIIQMKLVYYNKNLVLSIKNTVCSPVTSFETRKLDKHNHGLGIKSIRKVVEKYNGSLEFQQETGFFITQINLWDI
ncbi:sensor histidine kinase [Anaeromicropila populeti]|uniref:Sensor histidine kinase YesM n=1 Tax=Anaeromicropila populeti TaxID=37658 RepID=A0A1I6JNH0_9FIRM|nr:sensor histidine kinase [Anaeromicropila populeti]SFR80489.1 Sensor histidine kinase YesM [Anaeromicropila populeti]